jgi:hypothetical protein
LIIALANGFRHLVRLAQANAHVARFVPDDDERRKAEATATLDDLGDAVDVHHALLDSVFV